MEMVCQRQVKLAFGDAVAGEFSRIRAGGGQIHVMNRDFQFVGQLPAEGVDGARDVNRADAVHLRVEVHVGVLKFLR